MFLFSLPLKAHASYFFRVRILCLYYSRIVSLALSYCLLILLPHSSQVRKCHFPRNSFLNPNTKFPTLYSEFIFEVKIILSITSPQVKRTPPLFFLAITFPAKSQNKMINTQWNKCCCWKPNQTAIPTCLFPISP